MNDWFQPRRVIEKAINGALKSSINAHGPINLDNISSASKRVYSTLRGIRKSSSQLVERAVRIELQLSRGAVCSFTVQLKFLYAPQTHDFLVFESNAQITTKISHICHYFKQSGNLILTEPIICESYDGLLLALDWFKANFMLTDIKSDDNPQSYYIFYRSLLQLLKRSKEVDPRINLDPTAIKIFAESCRAILLAEIGGGSDDITNFNPAIEDLHRLILFKKLEEPDGVRMLLVVKEWEQRFNQTGKLQWTASLQQCQQAARLVFGKIRSIPTHELPDFGDG